LKKLAREKLTALLSDFDFQLDLDLLSDLRSAFGVGSRGCNFR